MTGVSRRSDQHHTEWGAGRYVCLVIFPAIPDMILPIVKAAAPYSNGQPLPQWMLPQWILPQWMLLIPGLLLLTPVVATAQTKPESIYSQPAILGTGLLMLLIVGTAVVVVFLQLRPILHRLYPPLVPLSIPEANPAEPPTGEQFDELRTALVPPRDDRGLVQRVSHNVHAPLVSDKKEVALSPMLIRN